MTRAAPRQAARVDSLVHRDYSGGDWAVRGAVAAAAPSGFSAMDNVATGYTLTVANAAPATAYTAASVLNR